MSEPERDDERDQPGGEVVAFPGVRAVPEVAADAALEPAPLEGEIVGEEEYARRTGLHRYAPSRVVHLVTVVRASGRTTGAGRAVLRTGLAVGQGVGSWARRGLDAVTLGVYRRAIEAAEAAGDSQRLADWTTRREQVRERRHRRLMDAPKLAAGLALVTAGGLVALVVGVLLVGLLVQVSGAGRFLGVLHGVMNGVRWTVGAVPVVCTVALLVGPPLLLAGAWREGRRRGTAPGWLAAAGETAGAAGVLVTADGIVRALQHLGVPALSKAFKGGWVPRFVLVPTREGQGAFKGYRAIFDLPLGVTPAMVADRREVLATNLSRITVEVWPSDYGKERGGKPGHVNLYVADSGVMDKPTPQYPLMHDGVGDVFAGVPVGITQRGDVVVFALVGANFVFGGQPGQGKSNVARVVMAGAALDPLAELRVHVFANNGDFDAYGRRLSRYHKGASPEHADLAAEHLRELFEEVGRREGRLAELGAKKLTRAIAAQHPDMRPMVVLFSECHELFGDGNCGELAADLAIRTAKRGRKTGVTLGFDTQSSRTDAIPSQLVENVGINGCFSVKTWRSNDGFLGDGSFAAGIRATELRFNVDRGTMVATGVSDELFEIVRTYFIEVNDDTGWDAAADIIDRALTQVDTATPIGGDRPTPQIATTRELLADLDEVLGAEAVPSADVPALLARLAPQWAPYRELTGKALRDQLGDLGIKVPSTGNRWPLDPVTVREALTRRATADLDDDS